MNQLVQSREPVNWVNRVNWGTDESAVSSRIGVPDWAACGLNSVMQRLLPQLKLGAFVASIQYGGVCCRDSGLGQL